MAWRLQYSSTRSRLIVMAIGAVIAGVALFMDRDRSPCEDLRAQYDAIEAQVPDEAAQSWEDIEDLQSLQIERDRIRAELVELDCN